MANTMDVVTSETQLARNSLPLCIGPPGGALRRRARRVRASKRVKLTKSACLLHAEADQGYTVHANACRTASFAGCDVVSARGNLGVDDVDRGLLAAWLCPPDGPRRSALRRADARDAARPQLARAVARRAPLNRKADPVPLVPGRRDDGARRDGVRGPAAQCAGGPPSLLDHPPPRRGAVRRNGRG